MGDQQLGTSRMPLRRPVLRALLVVGTAWLLMLTGSSALARSGRLATMQNPVSASFADTFADPSIIQAKDGWWYAYATSDPLRAGGPSGGMHIARTRDFDTWEYRGTVFTDANRPSWATATSGLWAPDIRYLDGRYVLYFTVTDTTLNAGDDSAIGVATAPTPTGPWTATAAPVVAPRPAPGGGFLWTFDPAGFTDTSGHRYLYYGSYFGGIYATRLSANGLTSTGAPAMVAIDNRYEGAYVVRHGRWYYLMASSANCCAGPTTGYSVFAGRSRSPLGPFVDADGISLRTSRVGGTIVVTQNGNRWIGAGHNAMATDNAGRTFLVYHAIDRHQPWLDEPFGINRRPMLMDRLDWVHGWPRVRAGAGPSSSPQPAPVTGSALGITSANPAARGFRHLEPGRIDPQSGRTGHLSGTAVSTATLREHAVRIRLDVKGGQPVTVTLGAKAHGNRGGSGRARITVDPQRGRLVLVTTKGHKSHRDVATIPTGRSSWRTLIVEVRRSRFLVQLSESDLADPLAEIRATRPGFRLHPAPIRLTSPNALIDNVSVRPLAVDAARLVAVPQAGRLLAAEEFTGALSSAWTWVRKDSQATVSGGRLNWPLEAADLVGGGNDAGVLLHDTPAGSWIAETKVRLDLGVDEVRNYQQAGLIAYESDDNFARLCSVAIWNTRQTEFGRELVATADGQTSYGGANIGTPAPTVWLRLAHTRNGAGEHRYRAGTSRDGQHWTWGAVWTFPAAAQPRIGLVAHGGDQPPVVASFDYLRFYAYRSR